MTSITLSELKENYPNIKFINLLVNNKWQEVLLDTLDITKTKKLFDVDCISYYAYDKNGNLLNPITQLETIKKAKVKLFDRVKLDDVNYNVILEA